MKVRRIFLFLIVLTTLTGCSDSASTVLSYNTPEKVVQAFFKDIEVSDYNSIINLCPIKEMADNYNFKEVYDRVQGHPSTPLLGPSDYYFYKKTNADIIKGNIATQLTFFATSFTNSSDISDYIKEADTKILGGIKVISIDKPSRVDSDESIDNFKKNSSIYGAEDMTERVALIELNGNTYLSGFTLIKYNGSWGIQSLISYFAGMETTGRVSRMTKEDYNKIIR